MSDHILIPLPGLGTLRLPVPIFEQHLVRSSAPHEATAEPAELVDAMEMERRTGVPASWWASAARERRVPARKVGRYIRFDPREAIACEDFKRRAIAPGALDVIGHPDRKGLASA